MSTSVYVGHPTKKSALLAAIAHGEAHGHRMGQVWHGTGRAMVGCWVCLEDYKIEHSYHRQWTVNGPIEMCRGKQDGRS